MENSDIDSLITKKKDLLRKEILDMNYDKEIFLDFCTSKKENGDDLDVWTLNELEQVISEFKEYINNTKDSKVNLEKLNNITKQKEDITIEVEQIKIYVIHNKNFY